MKAFLFLIFNFGRQAFKFKMATNFSDQNDRQLFIYSYPASKLSQNIHSMYFVKPSCLCMFFSIAFSLQQNAAEHHRARFKSLENTPTWYAQSSPITLFLLFKNSRIKLLFKFIETSIISYKKENKYFEMKYCKQIIVRSLVYQ